MKECMIGVVFSDESEAKTFYKKVTSKKTDSGAPLCSLFASATAQCSRR